MKDKEYSVKDNCHVFEYINEKNEKGFLHCHEEATEIIFLKSGKLDVWLEKEKFTLKEGDVFVINPGEKHFTEGFLGTHILVSILGSNIISAFYTTSVNILNLISSEK